MLCLRQAAGSRGDHSDVQQHLAGAPPHFASGLHSHSCIGLNGAIATATAAAPSTWCHLVMLFNAFKEIKAEIHEVGWICG